MHNNDDDNWLEGAFLAQEEYDRDKDKWKGKRKEMEDHFFSAYDTLPDTRENRTASTNSSSNSSGNIKILILMMMGFLFICIMLTTVALLFQG